VLASGGVASGAVELRGSLSGSDQAGLALAITGLPPVRVAGGVSGGVSGGQSASVSSLFGLDLAARGLRLLERVGLPLTPEGAVAGAPRVFAAGDVLAPEPPSVAYALESGLQAGARAAAVS
jgi:hypothetical protein